MQARSAPVQLFPLALFTTGLPLLTMHLSYLLSAWQGHVEWCVPYLEPCTSISRAGRHGTAYFLFKGGMLPALTLLALFWWANRIWVRQLGGTGGRHMPLLGLIASLSLLVYTLSLGHSGDAFFMLRRAGVLGYLGLTFICQLQLNAALERSSLLPRHGKALMRLSMATLGIGLLSLAITIASPELGNLLEDVFEWWLVLLLNLHALVVTWLWRRTRFSLSLGLGR